MVEDERKGIKCAFCDFVSDGFPEHLEFLDDKVRWFRKRHDCKVELAYIKDWHKKIEQNPKNDFGSGSQSSKNL